MVMAMRTSKSKGVYSGQVATKSTTEAAKTAQPPKATPPTHFHKDAVVEDRLDWKHLHLHLHLDLRDCSWVSGK